MAERKKGGFFGTPMIIVSFVLVFFILFDFPKGIRDGTALLAGFVLQPLIGFGGRFPLLTIFLASVVLVIATTAIRHFLVDWTKMARVQEAMRTYSSEMREARKSNNTYKLKKLTEAQQDVMQLQAEVQTEQMKPMALTMLLVIPIFAWLGAFLAVPIVFDADEPPAGTYALVAMERGEAEFSHIVMPGNSSFTSADGALVYALRLEGASETAPLAFQGEIRGGHVEIPTAAAPTLPDGALLTELPAGLHTFRVVRGEPEMAIVDATGTRPVGRAVVVVKEDTAWRTFVVGTEGITVTTGAGDIYAFVPTPGGDARLIGGGQLAIDEALHPLVPGVLVTFQEAGVDVLPVPVKSPWSRAWDVLDPYTWFTGNPGWFPRWIVLYSLFGIPFGQIAQRALKLWEYRHVDLDADGVPAGKNV